MKVPKKINILGLDFKVRHIETEQMKRNSWVGCVDSIGREICIDPSIPDISKAQILLHEIIHVIDYHMSGEGRMTLSEEQTDRLATGIYAVLKNNKVEEWL